MSNNELKEGIKVIQLNPKFRLFLLIFTSWFNIICILCLILCHLLISYLSEHFYLSIILCSATFFWLLFYDIYIMRIGIKYLPKDLHDYYVSKNIDQLQKLNNLDITNVTRLFNVVPICNEVYSKRKQNFETRVKEDFIELSNIEENSNRLVVNGKIDNLDFSWGIVTKMKKNNFKVFMLGILYFGPIVGIFMGLLVRKYTNTDHSESIWWWRWEIMNAKKYRRLGCLDLFPYNVGRVNSENYLIFSAKLKNRNDLITLIPKSNVHQSLNFDVYEYSTNISDNQKMEFQKLIQDMSFLPSIYIYKNDISIVIKKYQYNDKDNSELQTWELLKDEQDINDVQFSYLNNAIKIYNIFNY